MRKASLLIAIAAGALGLFIGGFAAGRATASTSGQALLVVGAGVAALLAILATYVTFRLSSAMGALTEQLEEAAEGEVTNRSEVRSVGLAELDEAAGKVLDRLREERARAVEARQEVLDSASKLGEVLQSTLDLQRILKLVLDVVSTRLSATHGAIYVLSEGRDRLEAYTAMGIPLGRLRQEELRAGDGLAGWVAVTGEAITIPSLAGPSTAPPEPKADTALAVPISVRNRTYAVLALYGRDEGGVFRTEDIQAVEQFVGRAGVGIENVLRHQEAQKRSITDGLTGIWNRRYFELRAREEIERSVRFDRPFSLVMVDLDNFKEVNDRFGHRTGDEVLVEVARRMTDVTRELDTCARYGGEEFVLLLPETDAEGARVVAEKLRRTIATRPIHVPDVGDLAVTVSVGVAAFPDHGAALGEVLRKADDSLYSAKRGGKNRVIVVGDPLPEVAGAG